MKSPLFHLQVAVLSLSFASVPAIQANEVLRKVDFSTLPLGGGGFRPETTIVEEGGQRFLSKKDAETEVLFAETTPGAADLINYRTKVRFRYHGKHCSMIIAVKFRGKGREEADYLWYYVGLNKTELQTSTQHLNIHDKSKHANDPRVGSKISLSQAGFPNIPPGVWVNYSVDVGDKVLKVRLALDTGETAEWEFPVFAGTGGTQIVTRQPVDISEFVVERLPEPVVPKN